MESKQSVTVPDAGKLEKRTPRSIRFQDRDWERIEAFAELRGLSAAEFVRFATLAAVDDGAVGPVGRLAPLIERTFRYSYIMATNMREEMVGAGRGGELEKLMITARTLQTELLDKPRVEEKTVRSSGDSLRPSGRVSRRRRFHGSGPGEGRRRSAMGIGKL